MSNDQNFFLSSSKPLEIIEGNITSTSNQNELSTLDEPIWETVKRLYSSFYQIKSESEIFLSLR